MTRLQKIKHDVTPPLSPKIPAATAALAISTLKSNSATGIWRRPFCNPFHLRTPFNPPFPPASTVRPRQAPSSPVNKKDALKYEPKPYPALRLTSVAFLLSSVSIRVNPWLKKSTIKN
jgi:hypothetical protein